MNVESFHRARVVCLLFAISAVHSAQAADATKTSRPAIYDETADGARQISDAVARAKKENKRVLLQFGANWCGWCYRLHNLFQSDKRINEKLRADYVVALVDINKDHNRDLVIKYNAQASGLPFIVILDGDGKHLKTQNTGELQEGDHHNPEKVMAVLNQWAPPR